MAKYTVAFFSFPGNLSSKPWSYDWLIKNIAHLARGNADIEHCWHKWISDTPITMTRNLAVVMALGSKVDYAVMIDEDMEPDYLIGADATAKLFWDTSWDFLMHHRDTPCAVAAPYVGPPPHENCYQFYWNRLETPSNPDIPVAFKLEQFGREDAARRGGIEQVGALPTGLVIYDMRVFQTMKPQKDRGWFYYEWTDDTCSVKASTEDVVQTRDMSLAYELSGGKHGGQVHINWDAWAAHHKNKRCCKPELTPIGTIGDAIRRIVQTNHMPGEKLVYVGEKQPVVPKGGVVLT